MMLSIIVPVYNAGNYLGECLESLLNQTFADIEVLLVEDCSTDNSRMLCDKYASLDQRVKVFSNGTNRGVSYSRNFGVKVSSGEYIMFVDADDKLDKNYVEDVFPREDVDIVVSSFIYNDANAFKVPIRNSIYRDSGIRDYLNEYSARFTSSWAKIYRSSIIKNNRISFDENCRHGEDTMFLYDFLMKAKSIVCKEVYGYYYRVDHSNTLSKTPNTYAQYLYTIHELNKRLYSLGELYNWCAQGACINMTEYFLSRIIHNLKYSDSKFADKLIILRHILKSDYVKDAMKDHRYLSKGRKRRIFDFWASCGFHRLAIVCLINYKTI